MAKVALVKCETYDKQEVYEAVEQGVGLLGGPECFVQKGKRVLLKPNMLIGDPPERCATTHPSVLYAMARLFQEAGAEVGYGDSPGFGTPASVAKKCGLEKAAAELNVVLADFQSGMEVKYPAGRQNKKFFVAKALAEYDVLISLPKLKTHGLTRYTGCVKNQFGCVPGVLKSEFHVRVPNIYDFCKMLLDLNGCVAPRLYVMDGIRAMEGNGPRSGMPKAMNLVAVSSDPIALDSVMCRLIGLDPEHVPTIRFGPEFGAGTFAEDEIELLGEPVRSFKPGKFEAEKGPLKPFMERGFFRYIPRWLTARPAIKKKKCKKCGVCVEVCPVAGKAVDWPGGDKKQVPVYDYDKCIRCYCCQELCPHRAVVIKKSIGEFLFSLFSR